MRESSSRSKTLIAASLVAALLAGVAAARGVAAQGLQPPTAEIRLALDRTAYEPGEEVRIAALMIIEEGWHANSHQPTYEWLIPTELTLRPPEGWPEPSVSYPPGAMKEFKFTEDPISIYEGTVRFLATLQVPEDASPSSDPILQGSLRFQACDDDSCLPPVTTETQVRLTLGSGGRPENQELFAAVLPPVTGETGGALPGGPAAGTNLAVILLLAALGGLILNAMPCVLPVLSLKVFGLVKSASQGRSHVVAGGLATSLGILFSFWVLAGAAVLAQSAGQAVGWGTQFQHPGFVTFLAVVIVLFCLNLWGLFEIPLPGRLAEAASGGTREGIPGHFVSGLFATLMATPCSAPFLGTAVGFALSQPAALIFATFSAIGLGMATPYLILAAVPRAARIFPKPGAWMDHVRKIMGFLLAAAVVWLLYVLSSLVSPEALAIIELGLLLTALLVWMRAQMVRGLAGKRAVVAALVAAAAGTIAIAGGSGETVRAAGVDRGGLIEWVDFDRDRALALAEGGHLVFVDVTADWCLTCKFNERAVIETREVADAFSRHGVVPMKADWTNRDDEIGAFLAEFGKAGIPFYVLYRPGREPHVFSELLTRDSVVTAVREASGSAAASL